MNRIIIAKKLLALSSELVHSKTAMRDENARMQAFLKSKGVDARVKYLAKGSLRGTWRLYNPAVKWTEDLAVKLNELGFKDFDGAQLSKFSGNGGVFSVFVRGHDELLQG